MNGFVLVVSDDREAETHNLESSTVLKKLLSGGVLEKKIMNKQVTITMQFDIEVDEEEIPTGNEWIVAGIDDKDIKFCVTDAEGFFDGAPVNPINVSSATTDYRVWN